MSKDSDEGRALKKAIRVFTVGLPNDQPNGEAERQLKRIEELLDPERWPTSTNGQATRLAEINGAFAKMCGALSKDTRALRVAAEAYFGGDFRKVAP